jgi:hypothetical protein
VRETESHDKESVCLRTELLRVRLRGQPKDSGRGGSRGKRGRGGGGGDERSGGTGKERRRSAAEPLSTGGVAAAAGSAALSPRRRPSSRLASASAPRSQTPAEHPSTSACAEMLPTYVPSTAASPQRGQVSQAEFAARCARVRAEYPAAASPPALLFSVACCQAVRRAGALWRKWTLQHLPRPQHASRPLIASRRRPRSCRAESSVRVDEAWLMLSGVAVP